MDFRLEILPRRVNIQSAGEVETQALGPSRSLCISRRPFHSKHSRFLKTHNMPSLVPRSWAFTGALEGQTRLSYVLSISVSEGIRLVALGRIKIYFAYQGGKKLPNAWFLLSEFWGYFWYYTQRLIVLIPIMVAFVFNNVNKSALLLWSTLHQAWGRGSPLGVTSSWNVTRSHL